jgi:hypothetical protein
LRVAAKHGSPILFFSFIIKIQSRITARNIIFVEGIADGVGEEGWDACKLACFGKANFNFERGL